MLVVKHSGGLLAPDVAVFASDFYRRRRRLPIVG
jgi:hypothetical protein